MMMDLRELYQDVILDHSKHPRNAGPLDPHSHEARGNNPLCGDRVSVYLVVEGDRIEDVKFEAKGCAISVASASMMTELVRGKSVAEAREIFERFHELVTRKGDVSPEEIESLDKLAALIGVREFPMRVKCATLPWHTMTAALDEGEEEVTTE
jgi:nitrogen fixation NifU-like protein